MHEIELVIGLLAAVACLGALAQRVGQPHAAILVLGGLVIGLIPGVPTIRLQPNLVLLGFIPPLVYAASFRAASFDLRAQAGHILTLSTGLVLLTLVAVAAVGHLVAGLPWASAFVLGALSGPTDPVSATSVMRQVGAPERLVAILEGESLINDGTGLATFQVAVVAVGSGFSLGSGVVRFIGIALGGCAIGMAVGWVLVQIRSRLNEPSIEIVISLVAAFGSYTAAQAAGLSGVLAAVTAGLYAGGHANRISSAQVRLHTEPFFDALSFVLESVLFLLIGLQLPALVHGVDGSSLAGTIAEGAAVTLVALAVRAAWMAALGPLQSALGRVGPRAGPRLGGPERLVLGLSGMRGALSLAGALSIPAMASGHAFPARDHVIFLVYLLVIGTLVIPSLTLAPLVRRLGLARGEELVGLEIDARARVVHAALARLEELAEESDAAAPTLERLRVTLELRLERLQARRRAAEDHATDEAVGADETVRRLRWEVIQAERRALATLREERRAPAQVLARIQRDIDLDETRLQG
jgi:monovalent cation/hydrogen antiporter